MVRWPGRAGPLLCLALSACGQRPEGWTEATHAENAPPAYDVVFPRDRVISLDIQITPQDWQAMFDDMTEMAGPFGQGGQTGPPQQQGQGPAPGGDAAAACVGRSEGDVCTVGTVTGRCTAGFGPGQLVCAAEGPVRGGPGNPGQGNPGQGNVGAGNEDAEFFPRTPIFVPCIVSFEGRTWQSVGIRMKGNSTLSGTWRRGVYKLPFRLDFAEFGESRPQVSGQRFQGFKLLSLTSSSSDSSFQREKLADDLLEEAGVPVGRSVFARLHVDHGQGRKYFGLYTVVEVPDLPLLRRVFDRDDGNLYKPQGRPARWVAFDRAAFDKKTNKSAADWSDVEAAVQALNASRSDAFAWRAGLEAVFNVDAFLRWLAMNTLIANGDTYGGLPHNYYLYGNPADRGRIRWIAWDHDLSFGAFGGGGGNQGGAAPPGGFGPAGPGQTAVGSFFHDGTSADWPLIRFLLDDPVYREAYRAHLADLTARVFLPDQINARLRARRDLIAPHVIGPDGEQPGYTFLANAAAFDQALAGGSGLMASVTRQAQLAQEALRTAR
jgi:spore coat protein H